MQVERGLEQPGGKQCEPNTYLHCDGQLRAAHPEPKCGLGIAIRDRGKSSPRALYHLFPRSRTAVIAYARVPNDFLLSVALPFCVYRNALQFLSYDNCYVTPCGTLKISPDTFANKRGYNAEETLVSPDVFPKHMIECLPIVGS